MIYVAYMIYDIFLMIYVGTNGVLEYLAFNIMMTKSKVKYSVPSILTVV